MTLNYIWVAFIVIAFAVATCRLIFFHDTDVFTEIVTSTFSAARAGFDVSIGLTGILSLWLGPPPARWGAGEGAARLLLV